MLSEAQVTGLSEFRMVLVATRQRLYLVTVNQWLLLADVLFVDRREVLVGLEPALSHDLLERRELLADAILWLDRVCILHRHLVGDRVANACRFWAGRVQEYTPIRLRAIRPLRGRVRFGGLTLESSGLGAHRAGLA